MNLNYLPKFKLIKYDLIDIEKLFKENDKEQSKLTEESKRIILKEKFQNLINRFDQVKKYFRSLWEKDLIEKRIESYKIMIQNDNFFEEQLKLFDYANKLKEIFQLYMKGNKFDINNIEEYKSFKNMNNVQFLNQMIFELNNYSNKQSLLIENINAISFFFFY